MNVDVFRHFYDYHFSENRSLWDNYVMTLSQEQFTQPIAYLMGSVRNQVVHMMNVDMTRLHDFGLKTAAQDYIFYVYDHPM
jgi:uncharacterized damage-inducible protein DinB